MKYPKKFDVIVIGGGHAGVEACLAAARMGQKTLLLTQNIETLGQMSCNPSMGGIGKGQLMKEIDALDGAMAWCADQAAIHMKILNRSKGPAMHGHHGVLDRQLYRKAIRETVENQPNLSVFQQSVEDVLMDGDRVVGVKTQLGIEFSAKSVVLTAGTFLNGKIHVGLQTMVAGRAGDPASIGLAQRLKELKLPQGRLKTGTPARIDGRTIDFSRLEAQWSDDYETPEKIPVFSELARATMHPQQRACYLTNTNEATHAILRTGFDESPMFTGVIEGKGPRYCPSIEDKITRFAEKESHQIILEPEGVNAGEWYPNGISTSLPFHIQYEAIRSIKGLENAHLTRPGYAIEYDFYDPRALSSSLELRAISGLFLAGQCIGTTGYSEAAALGTVAGINAALHAKGMELWTPHRSGSYLGVMIDDLIQQGLTEPYRMFTSRSEYRLSLREDNADARLTEIGRALGVVGEVRWRAWNEKKEAIAKLEEKMRSTWINPGIIKDEIAKKYLKTALTKEVNGYELLKRPGIEWENIKNVLKEAGLQEKEKALNEVLQGFEPSEQNKVIRQVETLAKYEGYIKQQSVDIEKQKSSMSMPLPSGFDYQSIKALSTEVKIRLNERKPKTLEEASKIPGVTPSALSIVMIYIKKHHLMGRQDPMKESNESNHSLKEGCATSTSSSLMGNLKR